GKSEPKDVRTLESFIPIFNQSLSLALNTRLRIKRGANPSLHGPSIQETLCTIPNFGSRSPNSTIFQYGASRRPWLTLNSSTNRSSFRKNAIEPDLTGAPLRKGIGSDKPCLTATV